MEAWHAGGAETSQENLELGVPSEELIALLYRELHALASAWMTRERVSHTLTATGVVHEAYLRLAQPGRTWPNRAVFFSAAAEAMRRVLIDHARRKHAAKRGGKGATKSPVLTIGGGGPDGPSSFDPVYGVLELSSVLDKLKEIDPQAHRVVMLRYLAGLSVAQRLELMAEICDGVEHAHGRLMLYRDLKPANILTEPDAQGRPHPKIVDFGLARIARHEGGGGRGRLRR